jgi:hypothetical protein
MMIVVFISIFLCAEKDCGAERGRLHQAGRAQGFLGLEPLYYLDSFMKNEETLRNV